MKNSLSSEEIQCLRDMDSNTSWSRAQEIINGKRDKAQIQRIGKHDFFEFLMNHGCRDGKMRGFKFKDPKPEIEERKETEKIMEEKIPEPIVVEPEQIVEETSMSDEITPLGMVILKLMYQTRQFDTNIIENNPNASVILDAFPDYSKHAVMNGFIELADEKTKIIFKKDPRHYGWGMSQTDILELFPDCKQPLTEAEIKLVSKKRTCCKKAVAPVKPPVPESIMKIQEAPVEEPPVQIKPEEIQMDPDWVMTGPNSERDERQLITMIDILIKDHKTSTAHFARKMGIGLVHCMRLIDTLVERGVLDNSEPIRKILMTDAQLRDIYYHGFLKKVEEVKTIPNEVKVETKSLEIEKSIYLPNQKVRLVNKSGVDVEIHVCGDEVQIII